MNKYLMNGAAAAMLLLATSCAKDLYEPQEAPVTPSAGVRSTYNTNFVNTFGTPAANQNWGFGAPVSNARMMTRAITVEGDVYDKFPSADEVAAYFPTSIPADADEVADLETLYQGKQIQTEYGEQTMWGLYQIYAYKIVEGYNLKITQAGTTELGGNYQNAGWDSSIGRNLAYPYNVYVNVPEGKVTLKRVGATHFNLYILSGEVTLESDYGEQAGLISVAPGATLIDQRNSIAANQGVKIFNRGTINATNPEKYDIGNFCTVYNEGKFTAAGPLTYSPGDANTSYFMNLGDDAELTAPKMTLNSAGNFFNSGKAEIAGETNVTQARIYWVNDGFYRTGTMTFSAKNATFYNYCQLIVVGNAHMYDGEFNLMEKSYTEAGTAELDNFIVNMGSNTGMHIKGAVDMKAQGDGTYQGFYTNASNDYLLIDGTVTVASHYHTFSISQGITYSINKIEIKRGNDIVTEAQLQAEGSGDYPVLDFNGTECPYGKLTATPNTNSCGATWTVDGGGGGEETLPSLHVMAEDLSATEASDFDFNDCVIDVYYVDENTVNIILFAAGGALPLRINKDNNWEIHKLFGVDTRCMVNTGKKYHVAKTPYSQTEYLDPVSLTLTGKTWSKDQNTFAEQVNKQVILEVYKEGAWYELKATQGQPACKIATPVNIYMNPEWYSNAGDDSYRWAWEKQNIGVEFQKWVQNPSYNWYRTK